jgi:hypothetical protein
VEADEVVDGAPVLAVFSAFSIEIDLLTGDPAALAECSAE